VFAFGCATTSEEEYLAHATPTIDLISEPSSLVMRRHGFDSIQEPYNEMLVEAARRDDLEALALLHQDVSISDPYFLERARAVLAADELVAAIGAAGGCNGTNLAWWEGDRLTGRVEAPRMVAGGNVIDHARGIREVEAIDGILIVLSAWAVRELRFDRALGPFDGYDLDICLQARARGRRVVVADFRGVTHHVRRDSFFDRARWTKGAVALRRKWEPGLVSRQPR
jgi:hypothetical protein